MDPSITHNHHQLKKNVPELHAGDRVRVHQKIQEGTKSRIQVFEGLVMKTQHGNGINGTFTVRRISLSVGVEKCFPLHLPSIVKIEKVKSAKVRRAKLFYVRGLVGKRAQRLKKEKNDAGVWEDVIVEGNDSEKGKGESEKEETGEDKKDKEDKSEEKSATEKVEEKPKENQPKDNKPEIQTEKKEASTDKDKK